MEPGRLIGKGIGTGIEKLGARIRKRYTPDSAVGGSKAVIQPSLTPDANPSAPVTVDKPSKLFRSHDEEAGFKLFYSQTEIDRALQARSTGTPSQLRPQIAVLVEYRALPKEKRSLYVEQAKAAKLAEEKVEKKHATTRRTRSNRNRGYRGRTVVGVAAATALVVGAGAIAFDSFSQNHADANSSTNPSTNPSASVRPSDLPSASAPLKTENPTQAPKSALELRLSPDAQIPANWPTTREALLADIKAALPADVLAQLPSDFADRFSPKFNDQGQWTGIWDYEGFKLLPGVKWSDQTQTFEDADGNVLTDESKIYKFHLDEGETPIWLPAIALPVNNAYLFVRTGGMTPPGQESEANKSRYDGVQGTVIVAPIEQASLIPSYDCDPAQAAWEGALNQFQKDQTGQFINPYAIKGDITIYWMNPDTKQLQLVDGRTIISLVKAGIDVSILEKIPAGSPLTPQEAAAALGVPQLADRIYFNPNLKTGGVWTYEGFALNPKYGTWFDSKGGVFRDSKGNVLLDPNKIYDFGNYDPSTWPTKLNINAPWGRVYIGRHIVDTDTRDAYYVWGNNVVLSFTDGNGPEQIGIILAQNPVNVCANIDAQMAGDSFNDAQHQQNTTKDRVWLWNPQTRKAEPFQASSTPSPTN